MLVAPILSSDREGGRSSISKGCLAFSHPPARGDILYLSTELLKIRTYGVCHNFERKFLLFVLWVGCDTLRLLALGNISNRVCRVYWIEICRVA